jgi:VanZ family protein
MVRFRYPLAWLVGAAVIVVTLGPVSIRPQFGHPQIERFAGFFILAISWGWAYAKRLRWVFAGVALSAVLLEVAQLLVPGRDAGIPDAVAKIAGAACGVISVSVATRLRTTRAV